MSRDEEFVDARVEELADTTDAVFLSKLGEYLQEHDAEGHAFPVYTQLLFHAAILTRLARIRGENLGLFLSRLGTVIRKRRDLAYAEVMSAMDAYVHIYDPFAFTDGVALMDQPARPVRWLVPGLITDGLTILGGTPKSGKSYLAYALALAVGVYGRWIQQWEVDRGPVLFISLEDDADDTRTRVAELDPTLKLAPGQVRFLNGINLVPSFDEGLIPWLQEALEQYHPRLLVIDPLSYLYTMPKGGAGDLFTETRKMLFPLRWLGKHHQCAIVALDHRRKRSRDDTNVFDTLHGSIAKQAVADALLMVERDDEQITMSALVRRGRDVIHTLRMQFRDGQCWLSYTGETTAMGTYGDMRQQVYTTLMRYRSPMTIKEIMAELDLPETRQVSQQVQRICLRGVHSKDLERTARGAYVWATPQSA